MDSLKRYMFLEIEGDSAWLMGYSLKLSPTEAKIINIIFDSRPIDTESILAQMPTKTTKKSIPVHINSINKKAVAISGKKLIVCSSDKYSFEPNM